MVYAVTTQTLPRRSSPSQCHTFHGTRVNVILLTTVIKVGHSLSADPLYRISQNSVRRYGKYGYTFIYLSAAFLTASTFRNSHSTFLWKPPTPNFIRNERKCRNCGGKKSLAPLCKEWLSRDSAAQCTRWLSPIPDLNRILEKMWQIRRDMHVSHKVKHDCQ